MFLHEKGIRKGRIEFLHAFVKELGRIDLFLFNRLVKQGIADDLMDVHGLAEIELENFNAIAGILMAANLPAMTQGIVITVAYFQAVVLLTQEPFIDLPGLFPVVISLKALGPLDMLADVLFIDRVEAGSEDEKAAAAKQGQQPANPNRRLHGIILPLRVRQGPAPSIKRGTAYVKQTFAKITKFCKFKQNPQIGVFSIGESFATKRPPTWRQD